MYYPLNYEQINLATGWHTPNTMKQHNNYTYHYWFRTLYQRLTSTLDFTMPEFWNIDLFYWLLFGIGFFPVFRDEKYGVIFQPGTLADFGIWYQPTRCTVQTPFIRRDNMRIGTDCELIRLTPDYLGAFDIIDKYACELSELDNSINQAIVNQRFAYMAMAKNKAAAQTLKEGFDRINQGEPLVVVDKYYDPKNEEQDDPFTFVNFEVGRNYITDKQFADVQSLLAMFNTEIGIPNIKYEKKERLTDDEAIMNNAETDARLDCWLEWLQESIEKVNDLFGIGLAVKRHEFIKEGAAYGDSESNADRAV